ncbi:energy-coupling factor ABC transporter permease [Sulfurivirga sp.]|uniref:energy-coupling factor ABC transporter permease n=1 Tax=Sulfurivirga sp. TaxID=2614236 RepID=UPI0025FC3B91|nr:energy-coupling factor ABC transporter permease [Sulfurivirga sp.]
MNLPGGVLPSSWIIGSFALALLVLFQAVRTAPWHKVKGDSHAQHVFFGVTLAVALLWYGSASIGDGLTFHFLMMTTVTLLFGWQFAVLSALLALVVLSAFGQTGWDAIALNWLLMGVVPALITWWILLAAYRWLPHHFFVYVFLNAFLAGGIGTFVALVLTGLALMGAEVQTVEKVNHSFMPYIPLLAAPEAFLNGFVMAFLVMFKPEWISTFTDEHYLKGK